MSSPFDGFTVHPVGSAPLIAAMCDEIDLPEIVNNMVKWDPKQCRTSPGVLIKSLVIDIQAPSAEGIADLRAKASTFILVTNVLEEKQLSAINVLKEYKEQTAVEVRFRFLKDPGFIDGIYLKNPERVLVLGYIFLMALLVYALLERRVRRNLKTEKEPLLLQGKRKSVNPTGVSILEMLESIQIARIVEKNQIFRKVPKNLINSQIRRVLTGCFSELSQNLPPRKPVFSAAGVFAIGQNSGQRFAPPAHLHSGHQKHDSARFLSF